MRTAWRSTVNAVISGAAYVAAINQIPADRECRDAFQSLALSLVRPGGTIFDFGCGPGLDARHYAEHGLRVGVYDVDPGMRAYFDELCAPQIGTGAVHTNAGSYAEFLRDTAPRGGADVDLITANFAPVNLVREPRALFAKFHSMLGAQGHVLASVLNPLFVGDLKYVWWWRHVSHLATRGEFSIAGTQSLVTRYLPRRLAELAMPHLALDAIYIDRLPRVASSSRPPRLPAGRRGWAQLFTSRFLFLVFRRADRP